MEDVERYFGQDDVGEVALDARTRRRPESTRRRTREQDRRRRPQGHRRRRPQGRRRRRRAREREARGLTTARSPNHP